MRLDDVLRDAPAANPEASHRGDARERDVNLPKLCERAERERERRERREEREEREERVERGERRERREGSVRATRTSLGCRRARTERDA